MRATTRDVVMTALLVSLTGTAALFSAIVLQMQSANNKVAFDVLFGVGILAWLYAGIAALEVADRRTLLHVASAAVLVLPVAAVVMSLA